MHFQKCSVFIAQSFKQIHSPVSVPFRCLFSVISFTFRIFPPALHFFRHTLSALVRCAEDFLSHAIYILPTCNGSYEKKQDCKLCCTEFLVQPDAQGCHHGDRDDQVDAELQDHGQGLEDGTVVGGIFLHWMAPFLG